MDFSWKKPSSEPAGIPYDLLETSMDVFIELSAISSLCSYVHLLEAINWYINIVKVAQISIGTIYLAHNFTVDWQ
jgi:hypothetical protein